MCDLKFDALVIGSGLSGLVSACRLVEHGMKRVVLAGYSTGATPEIAVLNASIEPNKWGDTPCQHKLDTLTIGSFVNDEVLVTEMCNNAHRCVEFLEGWGIEFAKIDGCYHRRHASGSTYPRSLCHTSEILGAQVYRELRKWLKKRGAEIIENSICLDVLYDDNGVVGAGFLINDVLRVISAPTVIAAWGGVGSLLPNSTYPRDVDGRGISMLARAGVELRDLEFVEFEPMVMLAPRKMKGEPCPTAMLGEGGYLLNSKGERFMLKARPEGEAGSPKTQISHAISQQIAAGNGSPNGGAFVDLRHIPSEILKAYPWFYNKLIRNGCDPKIELLEVGPAPHSHSGGAVVDSGYATRLDGLYAVGEAAGGIHGACRLAGNAATQALVSGVLAAETIAARAGRTVKAADSLHELNFSPDIREKGHNLLQSLLSKGFGFMKTGIGLTEGLDRIDQMLKNTETKKDHLLSQEIETAHLLFTSALARRESRGNHMRSDYPTINEAFTGSVYVEQDNTGAVSCSFR